MSKKILIRKLLKELDKPIRHKKTAVALIDSGILSDHPFIGYIKESVEISIDKQGNLSFFSASEDMLGHGSACAMVIKAYCPETHIYNIKIFQTELWAPFEVFEKAVYYAIEQRVDLINLSVDVVEEQMRDSFNNLCAFAESEGVIVVRALAGQSIQTFKDQKNIVTAQADDKLKWGEFQILPFSLVKAHPYSLHLPGVDSKNNFFGDSLSTAHITGLLSILMRHLTREQVISFFSDDIN